MARRDGKVAVLFRHRYYLEVPFVNASPDTSWPFGETPLRSWKELRRQLRDVDAKWVLKTGGSYPASLGAAFREGEARSELVSVFRSAVENFVGNRVDGARGTEAVELLRLGP